MTFCPACLGIKEQRINTHKKEIKQRVLCRECFSLISFCFVFICSVFCLFGYISVWTFFFYVRNNIFSFVLFFPVVAYYFPLFFVVYFCAFLCIPSFLLPFLLPFLVLGTNFFPLAGIFFSFLEGGTGALQFFFYIL